jgi:hypothetical protein
MYVRVVVLFPWYRMSPRMPSKTFALADGAVVTTRGSMRLSIDPNAWEMAE